MDMDEVTDRITWHQWKELTKNKKHIPPEKTLFMSKQAKAQVKKVLKDPIWGCKIRRIWSNSHKMTFINNKITEPRPAIVVVRYHVPFGFSLIFVGADNAGVMLAA